MRSVKSAALLLVRMEGLVQHLRLLVGLALLASSFAIPLKQQKTLVLVDNMAFLQTHSLFFDIFTSISWGDDW